MVSTNAAKIMGLYPRKGALAVGLGRRKIVRATELHGADDTPWEGRDLAAWPSLAMLRGKIKFEEGTFKRALKDGQFLSRKVLGEARIRPAV